MVCNSSADNSSTDYIPMEDSQQQGIEKNREDLDVVQILVELPILISRRLNNEDEASSQSSDSGSTISDDLYESVSVCVCAQLFREIHPSVSC